MEDKMERFCEWTDRFIERHWMLPILANTSTIVTLIIRVEKLSKIIEELSK